MSTRRRLVASASAFGLMLMLTGLAWACTNVSSPFIGLDPVRGHAGSQTTVTGANWSPNAAVSIVWHPTGQVLGQVMANSNGQISARVTVPADAAARPEYVDAVQGAKSAATVFEVLSTGQAGGGGGGVGGGTSNLSVSGASGGGTGAGDPSYVASDGNVGSGGIPAKPSGQPAGTGGGAAPAGGTPTGGGAPAPTAASTPAPAAVPVDQPQPQNGALSTPVSPAGSTAAGGLSVPTGAPAVSGPSPAGGPTATGAGAVAAADSSGPAAAAAAVAAGITADGSASEQAAEAAPDAAPLARSAAADLWSGFASGGTAGAPSLADLQQAGDSGVSVTALGLGVLSVGLVALAAGFGVAEALRRRVAVGHTTG